jgi:DNA/RNA endonuclease YhcR with UshA esterase domain
MKVILLNPLLLLAVLLPTLSHAHHSFRGVYDFNTTSTIEGVVVELDLVNPHARVYLDITNEKGEVERWVIEAPGKISLARRGWTDDMFAPGEIITVIGNPSVTGKKAVWLEKIIKADGTELVDPLVADDLAIEAERRARLRKAQQ